MATTHRAAKANADPATHPDPIARPDANTAADPATDPAAESGSNAASHTAPDAGPDTRSDRHGNPGVDRAARQRPHVPTRRRG